MWWIIILQGERVNKPTCSRSQVTALRTNDSKTEQRWSSSADRFRCSFTRSPRLSERQNQSEQFPLQVPSSPPDTVSPSCRCSYTCYHRNVSDSHTFGSLTKRLHSEINDKQLWCELQRPAVSLMPRCCLAKWRVSQPGFTHDVIDGTADDRHTNDLDKLLN